MQGGAFRDQHYSSCSRSEYSAPQNGKNYVTCHMVPHALVCWLNEPEKTKKMPRLVLVRARTAVKISLRYKYSTGKIKSNPLEPHFQTSATMSRCKSPRKLLSLCHTVVRAPKSPSPGGALRDENRSSSCGRATERRTRKIHR